MNRHRNTNQVNQQAQKSPTKSNQSTGTKTNQSTCTIKYKETKNQINQQAQSTTKSKSINRHTQNN